MYKKIKTIEGHVLDHLIMRISDNSTIPLVDGNRHYEEYKEWLSDGNTPEEAE